MSGNADQCIAILQEGVELQVWTNSFHHPGVRDSLPLPLIGGFRCTCDPDGVEALRAHPGVATVEADLTISLTGRPVWQHRRRRETEIIPEGVRAVNAPTAWNLATGNGVKVAIIDTGVDLSHSDLAPNIGGGLNLVEPGAPARDDVGHGTHVAGIIAAALNGSGLVGVAPEALLYPVRVLGAQATGRLSDIILALQWAIDQQIRIVNLSLGTPTHVQAFERAIANGVKAGLVIVAGAGNSGPDSPEFPAAFPEVLAVGAVTMKGQITPFSSTGPFVDLVAPGQGVLSTMIGNRTGLASGTSMASPHVVGVAALYLQAHPTAGPDEVRAALTGSAVPLEGLSRAEQGAGFVDARAALEWVPRS